MAVSREKVQKLAAVARKYYLEDLKQSEIAQQMGVSRPMISKMLREARELGIVKISILDDEQPNQRLERLCRETSLRGGILVEDGLDDDDTNQKLSQGAVELLG